MVDHNGGNIQNSIILEEHDGILNAKRSSIVSAPTIFTISSLSAGTNQLGSVTISNPINILGNLSISSNVAWSDPKSFIGLMTVISGSNGAIQVTDPDGSTKLNLIGEGYTFADSKIGSILYGRENGSGAAAVAHSLRTDSLGNLLSSLKGNITISDSKSYIGLVSVSGSVIANTNLAPSSTSLNTYSIRLNSNTTTTPVSSDAYISSIVMSVEVVGTTSTVTIQDKQGTPLKLVNGFQTVALTTTPTTLNFQTPVKMTSGIDIITTGVAAATIDVWINYYT